MERLEQMATEAWSNREALAKLVYEAGFVAAFGTMGEEATQDRIDETWSYFAPILALVAKSSYIEGHDTGYREKTIHELYDSQNVITSQIGYIRKEILDLSKLQHRHGPVKDKEEGHMFAYVMRNIESNISNLLNISKSYDKITVRALLIDALDRVLKDGPYSKGE